MSGVLEFIDQFSFKALILLSIALGVLVSIPLSVWLVSQKTILRSRASDEAHVLVSPTPQPYGEAPTSPSRITAVRPFLGKIGDLVIIEGENLGTNPAKQAVRFGQTEVPPNKIISWLPDQIQVLVPPQAEAGKLTVTAGNYSTSSETVFTVYDVSTKIKVELTESGLHLKNGLAVKQAWVWTPSGRQKLPVSGNDSLITTSTQIEAVALLARDGSFVPFYVNPIDFGF